MGSSVARSEVVRRLLPFWALLGEACGQYAVDRYLLAGLVCHESGAQPYAIRVERGFFRRYQQGIVDVILHNTFGGDDRWVTYPDLISASYGLCQILYATALEHGAQLSYPTELCDPRTNLYLGARILSAHLRDTRSDVGAALLRYNGGGNRAYPGLVLAWRTHLLTVPGFARAT